MHVVKTQSGYNPETMPDVTKCKQDQTLSTYKISVLLCVQR